MVFSYSCNCRNNSTAPNTPENNGLTGVKTNEDGSVEYTPSVELSTNFMVVNSKGDAMKTTISVTNLKNATVKSVSLNNQNITLEHKDGVISITKGFDQITADKKPFELTIEFGKPADAKEKDTLSTPNKKFNIEIIKATLINNKDNVSKLFQPESKDVQFEEGNHTFNFKMGTWNEATCTLTLEDSGAKRATEGKNLSAGSAKKDIETKWKSYVKEYEQYFDGINWEDTQGIGTQNLTLYLKFKFKPEIEIEKPDQSYVIKYAMEGLGEWLQ